MPVFPARRTVVAASLILATSLCLTAACDNDDDNVPGGGQTPAPQGQGTSPQGTPQAGGAAGGGPQLFDRSLKLETVTGLESPTHMVFLGDNDLLVSQKNGQVVRVTDGKVQGSVIELAANFADERGVLGLALHPNFTQNHFVYVYWTWTGEGGVPDGLTGDPRDDIEKVPERGNRIDRFTWD